jgi:CubicO group peptidase (beta-lactamase class C family)
MKNCLSFISRLHFFLALILLISNQALSQSQPHNNAAAQEKPDEMPGAKQLKGFDQRMEKIMADWNAAGCAMGITKGGKLIYAKGFGYRDVENKLPVTPATLFALASNTKLFTATALGLLVHEDKLDWDKPIRQKVPQIQFYNQVLNESVTLRDMLSHRTGLSRHDGIWYGSNFSRKELFERIKYLEPVTGIRESFVYSNLMYMAAGEIIELKTGKSWEAFVQERLLLPLGMNQTVLTVENMKKSPDYAKPYQSNLTTNNLKSIAFYRQTQGVAPANAIISNVNDLSNWVICQLAKGKFKDQEIIPASVIAETMKPQSFSDQNLTDDKEIFYRLYGMGRTMTTYKGHLMTEHGGSLNGFLSQITLFPDDDLGIIVLTNSTGQSITKFLQYEIADRMLDLNQTLWHERKLEKAKKEQALGNPKEKSEVKIGPPAKPSHELKAYIGVYEDPAYGRIDIELQDAQLTFHFNLMQSPLIHDQADNFESQDDPQIGKYNLTFLSNPKGETTGLAIPMDGSIITFTKKASSN